LGEPLSAEELSRRSSLFWRD